MAHSQTWQLHSHHKSTILHSYKAYVAQQLKAKMLIIISDRENVTSKVEMYNDGMGFRVHIPTVMIGRKDGEQLIKEFSILMDARPFGIMSFNDSKRVEKVFNKLHTLAISGIV